MRGHEPAQGVQRALPVFARLVRVDGGGVQHLAGIADHRHFHAGADARVQPHDHALAGWRGQQQVTHGVAKHLDGHRLGLLPQAGEEVALQAEEQLDLPGPGDGLADQVISRTGSVAPAQVAGDAAFGQGKLAGHWLFVQNQLGIQPLERAPAKHRQRPVAGHGADGLGVVEVIAELRRVGMRAVLAVGQVALEQAFGPQPLAQLAHQGCILGPALRQQVAHAVQHCVGIGKAGFGQGRCAARVAAHEGSGLGSGVQRRIGKQPVGQRLDARLAGDHALGPAPRLERQVEVFQLLLGGHGIEGGTQLGRELALLLDALEHGGAAGFEFAQIGQADLQFAQLGVVQAVGGLFAVAGDEGHRGPAVEQFDGRVHLRRSGLQLGGNLQQDLVQGGFSACHRQTGQRG